MLRYFDPEVMDWVSSDPVIPDEESIQRVFRDPVEGNIYDEIPLRDFDPYLRDWVHLDPKIPRDFDTTFFLPIWETTDIEDLCGRI